MDGSRAGQDRGESNLAFVMRYAVLFLLGFVSLLALMVALVATAHVVAIRSGHAIDDPLSTGLWALGILGALFLAALVKFAYVDLPALIADWLEGHEEEAFWLLGLAFCLIVLILL